MRYLSVCSGIEAATVAWHPLGWTPAAFSEIDPFARAVLAHHYPEVPCYSDFTKIKGSEFGAVDLIVGGTPCQDFSVAGLRAGLGGERGALTVEFVRLVERVQPRWVVWENVPGVFTADGRRAFGVFLGALADIGYYGAWRVLDAQFFGVPQRRRRVFFVGHSRDWRAPAEVLFEPGRVLRHIEKSSRSRKIVAALTADGVGTCGADDNQAQAGHLIALAGATQNPNSSVHAFTNNVESPFLENVIPPITARNGDPGMIAYQCQGSNVGPMGTLRAGNGNVTGGVPFIAFDTTQITSAANRSNPQPGDPCHPLAANAHVPAIAFTLQATHGLRIDASENYIAHTLRGEGFDASEDGTGRGTPLVPEEYAVRRITPIEAERLQGFPDNYTAVRYRNKPATDSPRYRSLGNSMAIPPMHWLGARIDFVDRIVA